MAAHDGIDGGRQDRQRRGDDRRAVRSRPHCLPAHFSPDGTNGGVSNGSGASDGSPRTPPPPPPSPPYARGRNASFRSTRGGSSRSLSTARHGLDDDRHPRSKFGEGKDVHEDGDEARSRSLSVARNYSVQSAQSSESPLIDAGGRHRPRSRSRSHSRSLTHGRYGRPHPSYAQSSFNDSGLSQTSRTEKKSGSRSRSRSQSRSQSQSYFNDSGLSLTTRKEKKGKMSRSRSHSQSLTHGRYGRPQPQMSSNDSGLSQASQKGKKEKKPRSRSRSQSQSQSQGRYGRPNFNDSDVSQKSGRGKKESRSRSRPRSKSRSKRGSKSDEESKTSRKGSGPRAKSPHPSKGQRNAPHSETTEQLLAEDGGESSRRSSSRRRGTDSRGRHGSRGRGDRRHRSRSRSAEKRSTSRKRDDRRHPPSSSGRHRKFVVEVGDDGRLVQAFEFSEGGSRSPSRSPSRRREPEFIEILRARFSDPPRAQGRCQSGLSTKLVVESDEKDQIVKVVELPDDTVLLSAEDAETPSRRDDSPLSKRAQAGGGREDKSRRDEGAVEDSPKLTSPRSCSSRSSSLTSSLNASTRSANMSRTRAAQHPALRSSLRDSNQGFNPRSSSLTTPRRHCTSPLSVRFAIDGSNAGSDSTTSGSGSANKSGGGSANNGMMNGSEHSFESTESNKDRVIAKAVEILADRRRGQPEADILSVLTSSLNSSKESPPSAPTVAKSVSFRLDEGGDGGQGADDVLSALTISLNSRQDPAGRGAPRKLSSLLSGSDDDDLPARRASSFTSDQDASLASSAMTGDFKAAYRRGRPILDARDRQAQQEGPDEARRGLGLADIGEESDESSALGPSSSRTTSRSFQDFGARLDTSDRSSGSSTRQSASSKSAIDTSERSEDSHARRSVSFLVDEPERSLESFTASHIHNYPPPPPPRGRAGASEHLRDVRRARSLSRSCRDSLTLDPSDGPGCLVIDDASSLTASAAPTPPSRRGRSGGQARSVPPSRQVRSLSRTRDVAMANIGFREVDFDPAPSTSVSQETSRQGNRSETVRPKLIPPHVGFDDHPVKKSAISNGTEETYFSDAGDTYFTNLTSSAIRDAPFMNSTLTVFESECDDDDQSALSDPTVFAELLPPGVGSKEFQATLEPQAGADDEEDRFRDSAEECPKDAGAAEEALRIVRRSRIRRMLSRKANAKRRDRTAPIAAVATTKGEGNPLDMSDETRETYISADGSGVGILVEGARESLLRHQSLSATTGRHQRSEEKGGSRKGGSGSRSRLSKLLKR